MLLMHGAHDLVAAPRCGEVWGLALSWIPVGMRCWLGTVHTSVSPPACPRSCRHAAALAARLGTGLVTLDGAHFIARECSDQVRLVMVAGVDYRSGGAGVGPIASDELQLSPSWLPL